MEKNRTAMMCVCQGNEEHEKSRIDFYNNICVLMFSSLFWKSFIQRFVLILHIYFYIFKKLYLFVALRLFLNYASQN